MSATKLLIIGIAWASGGPRNAVAPSEVATAFNEVGNDEPIIKWLSQFGQAKGFTDVLWVSDEDVPAILDKVARTDVWTPVGTTC